MVIKKRFQVIVTLFLFFGVLWTGQTLDLWQLKGHEIGGETLIIEVSNKYGIPLEIIYETWNIPDHVSPRAELAEARDEAGFSIGRFRIWVTAFVEKNEILPVESLAGLEHTSDGEDEIDLKGSTTIQKLSDDFGVPLDDFYKKFSIPESISTNTPLRELRENFGVELGEIKIWVKMKSD